MSAGAPAEHEGDDRHDDEDDPAHCQPPAAGCAEDAAALYRPPRPLSICATPLPFDTTMPMMTMVVMPPNQLNSDEPCMVLTLSYGPLGGADADAAVPYRIARPPRMAATPL